MSMEKFREDVIKKAMADQAFKEKLMKDPKAAIKEAFGSAMPDDLKVNVVVEDAKTFYIPLPSDELSDSDLDSAAGGIFCYCAYDCGKFSVF